MKPSVNNLFYLFIVLSLVGLISLERFYNPPTNSSFLYYGLYLSILVNSSLLYLTKKTKKEVQKKETKPKNKTPLKPHLIQQYKWASIGQLSAGIAHEINNPLGFIENNLYALQLYYQRLQSAHVLEKDMILELSKNKENISLIKKYQDKKKELNISSIFLDLDNLFNQTIDGIERISHIIKSLRTFSDISSENYSKNYNLNHAIKDTLIMTKNEYKYTSQIVTNFNELPLLSCHSEKINQVLLNLIVNAAQSNNAVHKNKEGVISIKTYTQGSYIICHIEDNGTGIKTENLEKIFNPFFTTKGTGTGLGLSISKEIIQQHQGQLWITENKEKGVTVSFKIPIPEPEIQTSKKTEKSLKNTCY